ncbi:YggU family protein [Oceanisphaera profunda]|uniref:UPF0235 protein CBP31_04960 n=1 Tax=Oceanisphaera profunda TaxID=1416627 RepID=A0A1Y0D3F2_9GAMM|nr:DUF167 family protein [Oceanisphaera profunda]ART82052.1 YggU family protein [Oceanisphaera profunda]
MPVQLREEVLYLRIYLQPKASRDQFLGRHGDALKIAITAAPVDGKANAHLLKWLAKQCRVTQSQVQLLSGDSSRHKRVVIESPKVIPQALAQLLNTTS